MGRFWLILVTSLAAGGLLAQDVNLYTIPNQSAHFVRMPSRESSTEIDAVFSNPAGLTALDQGWHLSVNNQFLRQSTTVTSSYSFLNDVPTEYDGVASSFIFPSVFAAYKNGRTTWSFALLLVGGAGGASYANLPTPDLLTADIVPLMQFQPLGSVDAEVTAASGNNPGYSDLTGYSFDFTSDGYGVSPGVQVGLSHLVTDRLSVAFGARFVQQYLEAQSFYGNVQVTHPEYGTFEAADYLYFVANDPNLSDLTQGVVEAIAGAYEMDLADVLTDAKQYGIGITPIIGLNYKFNQGNVGVRYEHNTAMTLKTTVNDGNDGRGTYTDGEKFRADLPGFLAVGVHYDISSRLDANVGFRYLFDKSANMNGRDSLINGNYWEVSVATQYEISDGIFLSTGYTYNLPDVDPLYQNEGDFRLPGHTGSFGGAWDISDKTRINAGLMYTLFTSESFVYDHAVAENELNIKENPMTFEKSALVGAIGLDFYFGSTD